MAQVLAPLQPGARNMLAVMVGLWPLVVVAGLAISLLWTAGMSSSP